MKTQSVTSAIAALTFSGLVAAHAEPGSNPEPIRYEVLVSEDIDAAWSRWTTPEGLQSFFSREAIIEPEVLGEFSIHFFPDEPAGSRGAEGMRILAFEQNDRFVFTWNSPPHLPHARAQLAVVEVQFDEVSNDETLVTLTHSLFGRHEEWPLARSYFDGAWQVVLARLQYAATSGPIDWDNPPADLMYRAPSREELEARASN